MGMVSLGLVWFICFFGMLISQITAQNPLLSKCWNDKGNYTDNSTYQTNLYTLLSNISSNTQIDYGFYNFSYGENSDQVNAIGLCRGDVKPDACRSCLNDSRVTLTERCPNQKEAIGWIDDCMLRYSNRSIFHKMESGSKYYVFATNNVTDVDQFNQVLMSLVSDLRGKAASGNSLKKYAAGSAPGPSFQTVFALLQCTPDLSEQQCDQCLVDVISNIQPCCAGKTSGIIVCESCYLRFSTSPFFDTTSDAPPPSEVSPPPGPSASTNGNSTESGKSNTSQIVVAVVVPVVAVVLLLILICIFLRLRKPRTKFQKAEVEEDDNDDDDDKISTVESLQFDFHSIKDATNNFADSNKLGQGGFGVVYMGKLPNGQEIAVKRLSRNSGQGDLEFKNEVMLLAKLQHRNLVRLLGFCLEGGERLLVYEFVPNKSLDYFIFDPTNRTHISWNMRYKIIGGIARGLLYLHEDSRLRIIHRDLKASNILLDAEMNPKISDFGMARLFVVDQTQGTTSRIVGTYGYMAPEYAMHGHFSVKSDVFSFGVMILEIVSGQKIIGISEGENVEDLLSYTWRKWREGMASNVIDPTLSDGSRSEMMRCIHIGLLCVQENIADRPTMAAVVLMLNSFSLTLPVPSEPAFYMNSTSLSNMQSWEHSSGATGSSETRRNSIPKPESTNEASITELHPR